MRWYNLSDIPFLGKTCHEGFGDSIFIARIGAERIF